MTNICDIVINNIGSIEDNLDELLARQLFHFLSFVTNNRHQIPCSNTAWAVTHKDTARFLFHKNKYKKNGKRRMPIGPLVSDQKSAEVQAYYF